MLNNDEKFSLYFLNEMNEVEKQSFEKELSASEELRNEFGNYKKVFNIVQETKNINLTDEYSQLVIPTFRAKLKKKQKVSGILKYGYAFTVLFVTVLSYSIVDKLIDEHKDVQNNYSNITPEEATDFAEDMNINFDNDFDEQMSESIDSLYTNAVNENVKSSIDNKGIESVSKDLSINELGKYLSDDDVNQIFAELSDKEILKR